jgi:hypothetical protein
MDIQSILGDLKKESERIARAIAALENLGGGKKRGRPAGAGATKRPRRHMSAAARKRISEMMKQRWAERKKRAKV